MARPPAAVVEQGVHGLLKHALFVADDDFRSPQLDKALEPVVPVDDPAVEVVQVRGGETPAIQGHQGPEFRRDDGNDLHDHPFRLVAGLDERLHDLKPFGKLLLLGLGLGGGGFLTKFRPQGRKFQLLQQVAHRLGPHPYLHGVLAVMVHHLEILLLGNNLVLGEVGLHGVHDHEGVEIKHLFQVGHGHVQKGADLGGKGLEEPDVGHGGRQFDVPHALPAHLGGDDLHAALLTDDAPVLHALVFAAIALVVLHRSEYLGAEEPVPFRLEGPVVDGFRLLDFAEGPFPYLLRSCYGNLDGLEGLAVQTARRRSPHGEQVIQGHGVPLSGCGLIAPFLLN